MKRRLNKYEGGGNPQEQQAQGQGQEQGADMVTQINQMLQQGGNPMEVVMGLMQQQMDPEQIVQILVQAGLPQEQAVQSVQQAMQQAQGQQQGQPQEAPVDTSMMEDPNAQAQPIMEFGGEFRKEFSKGLSAKLAMPSSTTEDYTNERFKVFTEAVRRNFAKSVINEPQSFQPLTEAEMGMDLMKAENGISLNDALKEMGLSKEQYESTPEIKTKVDAYVEAYGSKPVSSEGIARERIFKGNSNATGVTQDDINAMIAQGMQNYTQGVNQNQFYGYQDPRFAAQNVSPFARLMQQQGNRNYSLKNVDFNGVPTNLDMSSIIAGTNPNYTIDRTENYKNRKGLFRKEKGVRFYLNPKDGSGNSGRDVNGRPLTDEEIMYADSWDKQQERMRNGSVDGNGVAQPITGTTPTTTATAIPTTTAAGNPIVSTAVKNEPVTEESLTALATGNGATTITENEKALIKEILKDPSMLAGIKQPSTVMDGLNQQELGTWSTDQNGVRTQIEKPTEEQNLAAAKEMLANMNLLAKNTSKRLYGNKGLNTITGEYQYEVPEGTVQLDQATGFGNGKDFELNAEYQRQQDAKKRQEAWAAQGVRSKLFGGARLPDGTKVEYDAASGRFIPKKEFGGELYKAEDGMDFSEHDRDIYGGRLSNRERRRDPYYSNNQDMDSDNPYVDYQMERERLNRGDIADFSKNTADAIARFADFARNSVGDKARSNAFFSAANEQPKDFSETSRGIYTDQGDFNPVHFNDQMFNPTKFQGDNSIEYYLALGGDVSFSPEELEILKKAGYNLK